jgi:hypothetical protein
MIIAGALMLAATGFVSAAETRSTEGSRATEPSRMNDAFRHARDAFESRRFDEASRDIRAGADVVRQEANKATGKEKDDLAAAEGDLKELASRVEKGSVKDVAELNREFARADNRLAAHYQKLASESWGSQNASRTGGALETASSYFKEATTWTGEKASEAADKARTVSGKLIQGAGWVPKEVGEAITGLGHGIQDLGRKIEPGSSTAGKSRPAGD